MTLTAIDVRKGVARLSALSPNPLDALQKRAYSIVTRSAAIAEVMVWCHQ
jgi:hypothetical protein